MSFLRFVLQALSWHNFGHSVADVSYDGRWLAPVEGTLLSSHEDDHIGRGSVYAWDVTVPFGSPVYPMAPGRVTYAGCNNAGGYGCWAQVTHDDGFSAIYAHLIDEGNGQIWVNIGEQVGKWTPLGRVGWTGMTSFGPHVHWEIHHSSQGRARIDRFFDTASMVYCKFCASSASNSQGGLGQVFRSQRIPYYTSLFYSPFLVLLVFLILLILLLYVRPDLPVVTARQAGLFFLRTVHASDNRVESFGESNLWTGASLLLLVFVPPALCSTMLAFAIWMADAEISLWQLYSYVRYGSYAYPGIGYDEGVQYSAVWGIPCREVGTLGQICRVDEMIVSATRWQTRVEEATGSKPRFAVIPRLNRLFSYTKTRHLLAEAHRNGGVVIVDTGGDLRKAQIAIDRLVSFGLDGIAIDLEYVENPTARDIRQLAEYLAVRRRQVDLKGDGILVVFDVFHNITGDVDIEVDGVQIIPIFTGYGSAVSKVAGLRVMQKIFGVGPAESGMMTFDQRWPINWRCRDFGTRTGFDCQSWHVLFARPETHNLGWWVLQ
ncbi:M23 family metallopeptidase [Chloroflexi bacterium TSY]|nr:M23 family metallopeptidase [Chloroflexi bacterium TSY]